MWKFSREFYFPDKHSDIFATLGHDLMISVNDRVISRGFIYWKLCGMRSFVKISEFTVLNISRANPWIFLPNFT